MKRKFRITIDGNEYIAEVEELSETDESTTDQATKNTDKNTKKEDKDVAHAADVL